MRWTVEEKKKPHENKLGDRRIITRFLVFPKTLWSDKAEGLEKRWLEFAKIAQEYKQLLIDDDPILIPYAIRTWVDKKWVGE
jgi:hypothetical protein